MIVLPTFLCWMFKIPFEPLVVASIGLFLLIVLSCWLYSVAIWCNARLVESRRSSTLLFTIAIIVPLVYVLSYIFFYLPSLLESGVPDKPPLWLLPMHMVSMLGIFYSFWFTARNYKSLLENEEADFITFSSTFFLLFIFPLGVWIIQPSVNELFEKFQSSGNAKSQ